MRENSGKIIKLTENCGGGYGLNDNSLGDNEVDISSLERLFYEVPVLSEEKEKEIDEMIREVERKAFLEKLQALVEGNERKGKKKIIYIGRFGISRIACILFIICFGAAIGGSAYAAVSNRIDNIQVIERGDCSESVFEYGEGTYENLKAIEDYVSPVWVPEGYDVKAEFKSDMSYDIRYESVETGDVIDYGQNLPVGKIYYGAEKGIHEKVSFGCYKGEYFEAEDVHYLIVTDGVYIFDIISNTIDKETMIKMLE